MPIDASTDRIAASTVAVVPRTADRVDTSTVTSTIADDLGEQPQQQRRLR